MEHSAVAVSSSSVATPKKELSSSVFTFSGNGSPPCIYDIIGVSIFSADSPTAPLHFPSSTAVYKKLIERTRWVLVAETDGRDCGKVRDYSIGLIGDPLSWAMRS